MKLKAINPIDHDGKRYEPDATLDVKSEEQAAALISVGAAVPVAGKPETAAEKKARETAEADAAAADAAAEGNA